MPRERTTLKPPDDARIAQGVKRGETAEHVAAAIGGRVSVRTVGRRMRELRGPVAPPRASAKPSKTRASKRKRPPARTAGEVVRTVPEDVPDNTPLEQIDAWIEQVDQAIEKVGPGKPDENLVVFGQLITRAATLSETRRKLTPPERENPNEQPDMIKLAKLVRERLHASVDMMFS